MTFCRRCGDWGSIKITQRSPSHGPFTAPIGSPPITPYLGTYSIPCPECRPVDHRAATSGEQGDSADEIEIYRLRREVAELKATVAALSAGKVP
jgi:hypothetical protein